jgi:hypothetical protein
VRNVSKLQPFPDDHDGDFPIDLGKYQFTRPEAAYLARLKSKAVINWQQRKETGDIGWKSPDDGRWWFSIRDILALSVMADFCVRKPLLGIAEAAVVADMVVSAALDSTAPGANLDGYRPNANVLVAWDADGRMVAGVYDIRSPSYYPPRGIDDPDDYQPLRRGHLVIPATAMLIDVVCRVKFLPQKGTVDAD